MEKPMQASSPVEQGSFTDSLWTMLAPVAARLPAFPGSVMLAAGANLLFGTEPPEVLAPLFGKPLRIHVTDAKMSLDFQVTARGFAACRRAGPPVVVISASARDFLQLARRQADPDTLFFDRRLSMEGDTELGLLLRNTLDALDVQALLTGLPSPRRVLSALHTGLLG
jgi:predicted lipid carrier protein YhbT